MVQTGNHKGLTFGIFLAPFHRVGENPTLGMARDMELVEWLDELGFDEAWIGEHHSAGWETIASPEVFIGALIERTRFAISTEETRFYLNGIYLHAAKDGKQERLRAVATDGHRLARYELDLPEGAKDMPGVIVPRKTVAELRRLLEDADGAIEIGLSDTKV